MEREEGRTRALEAVLIDTADSGARQGTAARAQRGVNEVTRLQRKRKFKVEEGGCASHPFNASFSPGVKEYHKASASSLHPGSGGVLASVSKQLETEAVPVSSPSLRCSSAAVALIHCLSRETGPVQGPTLAAESTANAAGQTPFDIGQAGGGIRR
ncbi:hypothetical protein EYF80_009352 [Liparis tanakae]|uniref:Uncharacterized protein n=1 Tax=Liparis tanakae TaxID=230148 RepID=A0A4Z2IRU4_9TELE|nr:hypothetical protein EYF80_009352 [Liparis tanakae]